MEASTGKYYVKYISGLLIFGFNGVIASFISLTSYEIVLTRSLLGCLFLALIFVLKRNKPVFFRYKKELLCIAVSGAAIGFNWMCLFEGYATIGVSLTILACYCGPIFVMLLSPLIFKERLTLFKVACIVVVFCGMLLINFQSLQLGKSLWGIACGIGAMLSYSFIIIFNKKAVHITGIENSLLELFFAFVVVAVFFLCKQGPHLVLHPGDLFPVLVLGIVNTGLAFYLYITPISKLQVQSVAILGYLEPLSAVVFSFVFLHESMAVLQILGAVLILGGTVAGETFKPKKFKV